ncbi:Uncharacterized protein PECH_002889 [Penicillium ucsense]|uniref:Nuclear membrane fusion protein Kar5 n=1 Tax=Penicillium ucsense TaxID=2839758 RepID=A0A8J8W7P8_9EURO|nr:Uncharacterized protein PECM_002671 [Penicillium ucsense]KAF7730212.1 Uncharacterized protein PECH_002889 [Penicillium ucsense]
MKQFTSPLLLCLAFVVAELTGAASSGQDTPATWLHDSQNESNAVSYLTSKNHQHDSVFTQAVHLLQSLNTSPSCNRLAATKLVTSCQELGRKSHSGPHINQELDLTRSIYAARLAICELEGASALIPQPCIPVAVTMPTQSTSSHLKFFRRFTPTNPDENGLSKPELELCLKALESRPQWWTSYSNNRQNAMIICQASRIETEKDEILNLHQAIAEGTIKLNEGLQEALRQAEKSAAEQQEFLQRVLALQQQVSKELEQKRRAVEGIFDKTMRRMEHGFETVNAAISTTLSRLHTESLVLKQDIQTSSSEVKSLQQALLAAHQETITRSHELAQSQQQDSIAAKAMSSDLQHSLQSLADTDISNLSRQMANMDQALEWLINRLIVALEQESKLAERLRIMDRSVDQTQSKAVELQRIQHLQTQELSAQQQAQENIRLNAQVSQALLDKATTSAANLHTLLDEAALKFKQTPGLHQTGLSGWTLCIVILILVGAQNFKAAWGLVFFIFGHLIATTLFPLLKVYRSSLLPL